jgi:hypothetical protein
VRQPFARVLAVNAVCTVLVAWVSPTRRSSWKGATNKVAQNAGGWDACKWAALVNKPVAPVIADVAAVAADTVKSPVLFLDIPVSGQG